MRKPVIKTDNEKSQGASVARGNRYHTRPQSELGKKRGALKRQEKRKLIQKLLKLGKPIPVRGKRR